MSHADSAENKNQLSNDGAFALYGLLFIGGIVFTLITVANIALGRANVPQLFQIDSQVSSVWYPWILAGGLGLTGFLGGTTVVIWREMKKEGHS